MTFAEDRSRRRARGARWLALALVALGLGVSPGSGEAEDTDQIRFYWDFHPGVVFRLHTKQADGLEIDPYQQAIGMGAGVNLGRYFSLEVSGDWAQTDLHLNGQKIGEYGTFTLVPQARVRYPFLDGKLVPYAFGGVSFAANQFNDRKPPGANLSIKANDVSVVGSVGAGIDYFVANNISIGALATYIISRGQEIEIQGRTQRPNLDSVFLEANLRLLFPETPEVQSSPAHYDTLGRPYLGLQIGGAIPADVHVSNNLEAKPMDNAVGGKLNEFLGAAFGLDFTPYLGIEIAGGGYDIQLAVPDFGKVGKYAIYLAVPNLRVRYPLLDGRLVPYMMAGVGGSKAEVHDVKPRAEFLQPSGSDIAVVGSFAAGLDYLVARNIALGLELKYLISRGHAVTVGGETQNLNLDTFLTTIGVRIYFGRLFASTPTWLGGSR